MHDDHFTIVPLTGANQVVAASRVIKQCWQETYRGILPEDQLKQLDTRVWQQTLVRPGRQNLVALINERIVGVVSYGEPRQAEYFAEGWGELMSIYVLAKYQGKGIGTALMQAALQELGKQGFDHVALWVESDNSPAIGFYESSGWQKTGVQQLQSILGQPVTLLQYRKKL